MPVAVTKYVCAFEPLCKGIYIFKKYQIIVHKSIITVWFVHNMLRTTAAIFYGHADK